MPIYMIFLALLISVCLPHIKGRNYLLLANISLAAVYTAAMFLKGVPVGALVYGVVILGSASQILIPQDAGQKWQYVRIAIATTAVVAGGMVLYQSPIDLLAIGGFTISRFSETLKNPIHIKTGYFAATFAYMAFTALNGVWAMTSIQTIFLASTFIALAIEYAPRLRARPLAV